MTAAQHHISPSADSPLSGLSLVPSTDPAADRAARAAALAPVPRQAGTYQANLAAAQARYREYLQLVRQGWQDDYVLQYTGSKTARTRVLERTQSLLASLRLYSHIIVLGSTQHNARNRVYLVYVTARPIVAARSYAAHVLTPADISARIRAARAGKLRLPIIRYSHIGAQATDLDSNPCAIGDWLADVYIDMWLIQRADSRSAARAVDSRSAAAALAAEYLEAAGYARAARCYGLQRQYLEAYQNAHTAALAPSRQPTLLSALVAAQRAAAAATARQAAQAQRQHLAAQRAAQAQAQAQRDMVLWLYSKGTRICPVSQANHASESRKINT